ncbi:hypothetical protein QNH23_12980 [Siminovitchia fortis]|uniref:Uncharacterized protein n=1 Tax=Siminovitchia fortis TaxID=254758 RepID=A0A443IV07_9BACI|nr:hypothetical protein [Siminovitchia fortis]RWR11913.1 hypothetical protein D4N35_007550 [Siminovitchia fortis]WHY80826.1 hypothetical protein QNH23_12980 [Siminovitchia fortis]
MRGYQTVKKAAVYLNSNLVVKRLAILYLLFCIASLLTTPTTAHYTHEESVPGEMSVSGQLGEAEEFVTENDEEEKETDEANEPEENQLKQNEAEKPIDEKKPETGQAEQQAESDSSGQSEKNETNESQAEDQNEASDQSGDSSNAEGQESGEKAP